MISVMRSGYQFFPNFYLSVTEIEIILVAILIIYVNHSENGIKSAKS